MTEQERYLFDLQGYFAAPDLLTPDEVAELNDIMDGHIARECTPDMRTHRFGGLLDWGKPYLNLIDHPRILPYLEEMMGRNLRLDHVYADIIRAGKGPIGTTLHGGATPYNPTHYYHWHDGRMHNGLTVAAICLKEVNPGDGGFGCVPGSHKSNLPFPGEWRELETPQPFVAHVTGPAGSVVFFTEALVHGTLPWHGAGERRTLFYKYSPHPLSWAAQFYDPDDYEGLNERQRAILEAPNARYGGRKPARVGRR